MATMTEASRDPEACCVCGHHEDEHANITGPRVRWPRRCQADQPDRCSCSGYRQGSRFHHQTEGRHRA